MKRIRLGNTIDIVWEIFLGKDKDKGKYDLTGKKLTIYLVSAFDRIKISDFTTEFNVLRFTFEGKDQKHAGRYQMTFVENEGGDDTRTLDKCDAFELVRGSCMETDDLSEITLASSFDALRIYPIIPQVGPNRNWWVDGVDTGKSSVGLTAYEFAKEQGYEGTEEEYAAECLAVPVLNEESREATEAATNAAEAATIAAKTATDAAASANEAAEKANEAAGKAEEAIEAFGTHNIGSIDLFEQIIAQQQNYDLTQEDKEAILNGKVITTSVGNGTVPTIGINSIEGLGLMLMFHFNERLYSMCVMWNNDRCYINGFFSFSRYAKFFADTELSETSENSVQNKVVTVKLKETDTAIKTKLDGEKVGTTEPTEDFEISAEIEAKLAELSAEVNEVSEVITGVVQSSITTEGWTLVPLDKPIPQGATITEVVVENGTMPSDGTIYVQTSQGTDMSFKVSALPFLLTYDIAKMTIGNVRGAKVTLTWESPEGGVSKQISELSAEIGEQEVIREKLKGLQLLAGKALPYELSGLFTGSATGGRIVYEANATYNSILFYLPAGFTKFKYDGLVAGSTDGFTNYPKVGDMSEYRASVDKENEVISFAENPNGIFVILDVTLANQPTPFEPTISLDIAETSKAVGKILNPSAHLRGETLKVLNIGNSYTGNVTSYIEQLASAIGNDVSDLAIYRFYRGSGSFKSWVDIYNGKDTSTYQLSKVVGNLDVCLTPSESAGSNAELFVNALSSVKWDIILIQQASNYATDFDSWNGNGAGGYLSELLNIIRLHQPQATIGYIMPHSYGDNYSSNTEKSSLLRWQKIAEATKSMKSNYGIDFIIPYGTAVENLRATTANEDDFTTDGTHLASGLGCYCASCCYYQAILGARYGGSMWGNSLRLPSANNPVTDANAPLAQKAASAALCDMWSITNL